MSRHRNLKNLIAEDDYDDDYYDEDDDYYDDYGYDDYGDKVTGTSANSSGNKNKGKQQQTTKSATKPAPTTTAVSAADVLAPKLAAAVPAAGPPVGVVEPPPGWGKPTSPAPPRTAAKNASTTATAKPGISKPPPGWGSPSPPTVTAGISKPPPGWGSPPPATANKKEKEDAPSLNKPSASSSTSDQQQQQQQQQQSAAAKRNKNSTNNPNKAKTAGRSIPTLLLEETSASKKNSQLSMVVCGHVDAGKSTILGQLLYQLGHVTKRQAIKVSQSTAITDTSTSNNNNNNNNNSNSNNSIQWAWLLDEEETERQRGVTMQIATKTISTTNHRHVVILDAPGHADFIPTMITGAANADAALLVVDASEHIGAALIGGQTKEHVLLARGLGVSQVIVCVNKLDAVQPPWSQHVFGTVQRTLTPFLTQQANFAPKRIRFVPTSGLTGINIYKGDNNENEIGGTKLLKEWYDGPTLVEAIDGFQPVKQSNLDEPLRMILTDVYSEGKGVGARGRVVQGFIEAGERIIVLPIGDEATVASIQHLHHTFPDNVPMERYNYAIAGETIDLNLTGIDSMRVLTGSILSRTSILLRPPVATKCRAKIVVMDDLTIPIIRGAQVLFHIHSLDIPAVLTQLLSMTKRSTGKTKNRPRAITSSSTAVVEITLSNPICMEPFEQCRALGRFVLRRSGNTIAVGIIEEILSQQP